MGLETWNLFVCCSQIHYFMVLFADLLLYGESFNTLYFFSVF